MPAGKVIDTRRGSGRGFRRSVSAIQAAAEEQEIRRAEKRERLERMRAYAETTACRRELLLQYLRDHFQGPRGRCDHCEIATGKIHADPTVGARREVS